MTVHRVNTKGPRHDRHPHPRPDIPARAAVLTNCAANPVSCGYPGASTTGVPAGTTLRQVPPRSPPGPAGSTSPRPTRSPSPGPAPCSPACPSRATSIDDVYGDSTALTVTGNNISAFRTAMQVSAGLVQGNYIHDPGYIAGDHTNGIVTNGGTAAMTIKSNTVFNTLGQTDAISLDASAGGVPVANKTVQGNFLAGGYSVYADDGPSGNPTSHIIITGNRIGQQYYAKGGQFGAGAYYDPVGTGNTWTANIWDTTGQAVPSP